MNLQEIITAKVPGAVYTEAGDGMFTIPVEQFHDLARYLHDDPALRFDFLRSLTGMDWGEEGLGAVYHLESTATGENVVLKVLTPSREQCGLPTVSDIWKGAELNEREVFDFFGIGFINHPDMRRLYLRDDWVGYPLRKDYDQSGETNPLRMTNEVAHDSSPSYELQPDGSIIRRRNVLFEEDEYVINIGPQHPATHGVLRFRVSLEGEIIKKLDVHCGYIHRGIEKLCESLTYPQTLALTDRLDYLGASQNRHALCMCIEKGLGVEVSERVQYIRTIMDELQRIDSHLLFFACLCMDMGALTAFFYGFRDREKVLDILEQTTGGRLIQAYNTIGGVQADIHPEFVKKVKELIKYLRPVLKEYHETVEILEEKVKLALANNLKPIFCIGEVLEEREANKQNEVVAAQLASVFSLSAEDFSKIILAYEPVWAIGTGKTATAEQAQEIHAFIRSLIADKYGKEVADNTSILYGGSCKPSNAKELFANPDVDGGLIGGAALKVVDFKGIIDAFK
jgi:NADH-quinone oxidoreductase subunit C/D